MRFLWLVGLVSCAHAPIVRDSLHGQAVGWGEVTGDPEAIGWMKDALALQLTVTDATDVPLKLYVQAAGKGFDEPVLTPPGASPFPLHQPDLVRRVQRLHVTLKLVNVVGTTVAEDEYEEVERGPDRPRDAMPNDDLGVIVARRIVHLFFDAHGW